MAVYALGRVRPFLAEDVFVADTAAVIGDVHVGAGSSVWFGVVVRGDVFPIRIGSRTNIQDNSVVHVTGGQTATNIGDDVTIGHAAIIHGCTIGHRCLVGMGSIVLDGAVIDDESFIAAGTLIPPKMRVPKRSMVKGRPGKVVRTLADAEVEAIRESSAVYVGNARRFRESLERW